jgi:hypothetical protein
MIFFRAKGHGGAKRFYDSHPRAKRTYHVFGLCRVMGADVGFRYWRLIFFQWAFVWGYSDRLTRRWKSLVEGEKK